jgi:ribosomal protein S18 acetylase RimI-like enzyme
MSIQIRDYRSEDTVAVDRIALAAWEQYRPAFSDWAHSTVGLARAAHFAKETELLVAEDDALVVGFVCYVGPGRDREDVFDPSWALIRLLSVDPVARGRGIGRALSEATIERARRDGASVIALHTSPVMSVALGMYLRMGFIHTRAIPDRNGLPYAVYTMRLTS